MKQGVLLDECTGYRTTYHKFKRIFSPAYRVEHITDIMPGASDFEVWKYAQWNDLVVVTRDRGFPDDDALIIGDKTLGQVERRLEAILIQCEYGIENDIKYGTAKGMEAATA